MCFLMLKGEDQINFERKTDRQRSVSTQEPKSQASLFFPHFKAQVRRVKFEPMRKVEEDQPISLDIWPSVHIMPQLIQPLPFLIFRRRGGLLKIDVNFALC